jgi:NAD/NADP transhydrogenase beta subunit
MEGATAQRLDEVRCGFRVASSAWLTRDRSSEDYPDMKRPRLAAAALLFVLGIGSAFWGLHVSFKRITAYAEIREQRKSEGKTEAYLAEVESVNSPALLGLGVGALCFIGSIMAFVAHRKQIKAQKEPNQRLQTIPRHFPFQLLKSLARHV